MYLIQHIWLLYHKFVYVLIAEISVLLSLEMKFERKILVKRSQISRGFQSFQNFFKRTCFCSENLQSWFWLNALWRTLLKFCVGYTHPKNAPKNRYNALFVSYHYTESRFLCSKVDEPKGFWPDSQGKYKQIE